MHAESARRLLQLAGQVLLESVVGQVCLEIVSVGARWVGSFLLLALLRTGLGSLLVLRTSANPGVPGCPGSAPEVPRKNPGSTPEAPRSEKCPSVPHGSARKAPVRYDTKGLSMLYGTTSSRR